MFNSAKPSRFQGRISRRVRDVFAKKRVDARKSEFSHSASFQLTTHACHGLSSQNPSSSMPHVIPRSTTAGAGLANRTHRPPKPARKKAHLREKQLTGHVISWPVGVFRQARLLVPSRTTSRSYIGFLPGESPPMHLFFLPSTFSHLKSESYRIREIC